VERRWLEGFGIFISEMESSIVHTVNRQVFPRQGLIEMRLPTKHDFHKMNRGAAARSYDVNPIIDRSTVHNLP